MNDYLLSPISVFPPRLAEQVTYHRASKLTQSTKDIASTYLNHLLQLVTPLTDTCSNVFATRKVELFREPTSPSTGERSRRWRPIAVEQLKKGNVICYQLASGWHTTWDKQLIENMRTFDFALPDFQVHHHELHE